MRRLALLSLLLSLCCAERESSALPSEKTSRAPALLARYGCTACHIIPGVAGPRGALGPDLSALASRPTISEGTVPNDAANLTRFIVNPASLNPETSMPAVGVPEEEARQMATYLLAR